MFVPALDKNLQTETEWPQDIGKVYQERAQVYWEVIRQEPGMVAIELLKLMEQNGISTNLGPMLNTIVPADITQRHEQNLSRRNRHEVKAVA